MADYKIQIGTQLDTKGIDTGINKYHQKKTIEFKSNLDTSGIDKKLASYKAKKPIEVDAKLNTAGLAKKIGEYKPKTPVKLNAQLDTKNIDAAISNYKAKKSIELNVKLNHSAISEQIRNYKANTSIKLNTKLDNREISNQIKNYQAKTPIKLTVKLTTKDIDEKIRAYKAKTPIKLDVKINKGTINEQIKSFTPKNTIQLKASLQKGVIAEEIRKFKPSTPIRVALELDPTDIDKKISAYKSKPPVEIPAKLKLNVGDINSQLSKYKLTVPIKLNVKELDTQEIDKKISSYKSKVPIKVGVKLDNAGISEQIAKLPRPTAPINVGVKLDASAINADIALFKPTATLGIQPDLILENVDDQIRAYVPKAQIKVNVKLDENNINKVAGKQNKQSPIQVNVKVDTKSINEQLRGFTTKTKIKVGVKLDKKDIRQQLQNLKAGSPVKVNIKIDEQNVQNQINNIKRQIKQQLGNTKINLRVNAGATATGGTSATGGAGNARRQAEETIRAYRELASIQDRISTKQQSIARLDTSKNSKEILELSNQIARLNQKYQELYSISSKDFKPTQIDNLNRKFEILNEKLNLVNRKSADAQANLANSIRSGNFVGYDAEVQTLVEKLKMLSAETPNVKAGINRVKQALVDMKKASNDNALIEAEQRYQDELKETKALLAQNQSIERQGNYESNFSTKKEAAQTRLNSLFEKGSRAAKEFGAEAKRLQSELNKVGNSAGVDVVNRKISNLEKKIKNSNLATKTLGTTLKEQFSKYSSYLSIASVFMYATQAARSMFEQVKLIDSAMTELKKVTDETEASYNQFLSNAASKAKEIGTTIDGLVSSTADFARLGYGFEDAQGLAEVANIYAVVGDEIEGVEGATESLISTMAAFKDEVSDISNTDFAMDIVDKFNEIGKLIA